MNGQTELALGLSNDPSPQVEGLWQGAELARAAERARLEERRRIAQALHDTLAQTLFTIGLEAQRCLEGLPVDGEVRRRLQAIRRLAGRSGDELRSAIFALRSRYLPEGDDLAGLLREQVAEFQAQTGVAATLILSPQFPGLPPLVGEAVYRIVRESLSNVRKHAHASAVMVSLRCDTDAVIVTIQDDGLGLARPLPTKADDGELRFGVATMRQAAARAQGQFTIGDGEDGGVMARARFPLPGASA